MLRLCFFWFAFTLAATIASYAAPAYAERFTLQQWLQPTLEQPSLVDQAPQQLSFVPKQQQISYLKASLDNPQQFDLWLYDIADDHHWRLLTINDLTTAVDTQATLQDEQRKARLRLQGQGILQYSWHPDGQRVLIPRHGRAYIVKIADDITIEAATPAEHQISDAKFSPQGRYLSYIHQRALYVIDLSSAEAQPVRISPTATGYQSFGVAEFVAQEEMKRMTGYWWAPDDSQIAFTRIDDAEVEVTPLLVNGSSDTRWRKQRYPKAGSANAQVDLGLINIEEALSPDASAEPFWLQLSQLGDGYLARVNWHPNSQKLSYQWQSRNQQSLQLRLVDSRSPTLAEEHQVLVEEVSDTWVNLHDDLQFLADGRHIIWASERSGYKHLYLYRLDGKLIRQLTTGNWQVDALEHVDETSGVLYFSGRGKSATERHLYRTSLTTQSPSQPTRLSAPDGFHQVQFANDGRSFIRLFSSPRQPLQVSLNGPTGQRIAWLHENKLDKNHPLAPYLNDWSYPEFGELNANDGTALHYRLFKPVDFDANQSYPALVLTYGGPHAQRVTKSWAGIFPQYLAQQGYVVFQLDNRGSGNRGIEFENQLARAFGTVDVEDQRQGVAFLRQQNFVDSTRIGIFGHSYGGYVALKSVLNHPDDYAAAVAGAPVTDWRWYDSHYTERYMGLPNENSEAYGRASVLNSASNLQRPLLVYHGLADDNVHYQHTQALSAQLQQAGKPFEQMTYPGVQHSFNDPAINLHRYRLISDFFARHLKPDSN